MRIYIFSRPIHSGKTSELLQWCNRQQNIAGILMPDIDGLRKILDLETNGVFDIECADAANTNEPLTSVGRFHFYTAAFEKANSILINALSKNPDWLVIDEAGKLELDGKGFYRALKKATAFYSDPDTSGNLLITVRDSLCFEVIAFFNIRHFRVIYSLEELN
jgi:nucleoside-triphosphatase THEP1